MADIDWTKPIELSDGTPTRVIRDYGSGQSYSVAVDGGHRDCHKSGLPTYPDATDLGPHWNGRTVRNVGAAPFYMVWSPNGRAPTYKHLTLTAAETEAQRLATINPGQEFFVLSAVAKASVEKPQATLVKLAA